jgi:hypothetical protein
MWTLVSAKNLNFVTNCEELSESIASLPRPSKKRDLFDYALNGLLRPSWLDLTVR